MLLRQILMPIFCLIAVLGVMLMPAVAAPASPKQPALAWVDAETGNVLFTIDDIVRMDWDKQLLEISPDRATALLALPIIQRRDYAVKDRDGVIYRGRFYRAAAAGGEAYDGSTIFIGQDAMKTLPAPPFFVTNGGYPTGGGTHDRDRFSPRVHDPLAKAGLLSAIDDSTLPFKRSWSGHTWVGGEQVLKASAILFEQTFRMGQDAYLHLLLYKGQHPDFTFDKLTVEAVCTQDTGSYVSRQEILSITPPLLDNGIYVCKFRPWQGMAIPMDEGVNMPVSVKQSQLPRYPKDALNDNKEGQVVVSVAVDHDGKAGTMAVIQASGNSDLDKATLRSLKGWQFTPALHEKQAIDSVIKIRFSFADGKVEQTILPPEPQKLMAKPGSMDVSMVLTAYRKNGNTFAQTGSWTIPSRPITLLPATETAPAK